MSEELLEQPDGAGVPEGGREQAEEQPAVDGGAADGDERRRDTAPGIDPVPDGEADADAEPDPDDAPITDWSKVSLDLPEGAEVDDGVLASFGQAAVELGLSRKQAGALAKWQLDTIAAQREALMEAGVRELNRAWGSKGEANQRAVLGLISRIDRLAGDDSFSKALAASGATLFPGVLKGLLAVAGLLSEDSMGGAGAAGMTEHDETALEGLENALKEARRRGK